MRTGESGNTEFAISGSVGSGRVQIFPYLKGRIGSGSVVWVLMGHLGWYDRFSELSLGVGYTVLTPPEIKISLSLNSEQMRHSWTTTITCRTRMMSSPASHCCCCCHRVGDYRHDIRRDMYGSYCASVTIFVNAYHKHQTGLWQQLIFQRDSVPSTSPIEHAHVF